MAHQCKGVCKSGERCKKMLKEGDYCALHGGRKSPKKVSPKKVSPKKVTKKEEKYCSCTLKVAEKQSAQCLRDKAWGQMINGRKCYNPYAVCAKSTGGTSRRCSTEVLDVKGFDDSQLKAYARLHNKPVGRPFDRQKVLRLFQK